MNGGTATEKLGLGPEVRELKFGPSFSGKGGSFHTIRYDFKPASVDSSKMATLDVGTNNQVTISIPHSDGAGTNVFKGARKPYTKECVLIVDHVTGEVTIEKLTHTIQVKKTRQERPEVAPRGAQKTTPSMPPEVKKAPPPNSLPISQGSTSISDRPISKVNRDSSKMKKLMGNNSHFPSNHPQNRSNSPMMSVPPRHSPLGPSPGHISPNNGHNHQSNSTSSQFDALIVKKHHKPTASLMPSLGTIEDLLLPNPPAASSSGKPPAPPAYVHPSHSQEPARILPAPVRIPPAPAPSLPVKPVPIDTAVLSESSSAEDSSSSSSSEASDDSDSDGDIEMEVVPPARGIIFPTAPSMPAVFDSIPMMTSHLKPIPATSHLLSEDLQLSESGSDLDSD